jgi:hypothetical protein
MVAIRQWPWLTTALALLVIASPLGREVLHGAFISGEQLSRNIAQPLVYGALAVLVVVGMVEYLIKVVIRRRRRARNPES